VYNERKTAPTTRMATAAILRENLMKAKEYKELMDEYNKNPEENDKPEYDMKMEALLKVLNREIPSIIYASFLHMFMYNTETLIAKYSLGSHPDEMIEDYLNGIEYLENVGEEKVWYIDLLWMLSLGILLEVDKQDLKRLACVIEKQKKEDALLDWVLK